MKKPLAITLLCLVATIEAQTATTAIIGWGDNSYGQLNVPPDLTNAVGIAAGECHSLALKSDGTVVAWGGRNSRSPQEFIDLGHGPREDGTKVPKGLTHVVAIAAGSDFSLALKANGTVVAWGDNSYGQTNVPDGLKGVKAIAAGPWHCLALKSDGTVVAWGIKMEGIYSGTVDRSHVPTGLTNVAAIAAGGDHNLVFKANGTAVGWGERSCQQCKPDAGDVPDNLSNVIAVTAGYNHSLILKHDGTVFGSGWNRSGAATGSSLPDQFPWAAGYVKIGGEILNDAIAVSAGKEYSLAIKRDGTVIGWGNVPAHGAVSNIVAVAAGINHCLLIQRIGSR